MDDFEEFMYTIEKLYILSGWSKFMDGKKTQSTDDETTEGNTDEI